MKNKKRNIYYVHQSLCIIVTIVLCFFIYCFGVENEKACFALTLGAIAYLFVCFYNVIFNNSYYCMVVRIISAVTVIAFANQLYDYKKMVLVFPVLKNVEPVVFAIVILGSELLLLIIIKIIKYIYENAEEVSIGNINVKDGIMQSESLNIDSENNSDELKVKNNSARVIVYIVFCVILIGAGSAFFCILYNKGLLQQNLDFFKVVTFLLKNLGLVVMIFVAIVLAILFMIEMIRLLIFRIKSISLKENTRVNTHILYQVSIMLDVIICYLVYKYTDINMDSFYDFVSGGKYLALPLMILFVGIAFVIFLRLIYVTLVFMVEMKPENIMVFLKRVNEKANILERIVDIVKMLIDIVLNSLITALKFVKFIPDFFGTLYSFVVEDDNDCEIVEDKTNIDSANKCDEQNSSIN